MESSNPDPIWDAVRSEAMSVVEKDPVLRTFLYKDILSHNCMERMLGFLLANVFEIPTLSKEQLSDIFYMEMIKDEWIRRCIRLDLQFINILLNPKGIHHSLRQDLLGDPTRVSYDWRSLHFTCYQSLESYRVAHSLWNKGYKELALKLRSCISEVFSIDIHPGAKMGEEILLDDAKGLVIGETAVVGNGVTLMNRVKLGERGLEVGDRHPKIGNRVVIGCGASVLGNITVGDGAIVAPCSLVLENVPSYSMVAGNPAEIVKYLDGDPSLTMKCDAINDLFEKLAISSTDGKSNGI